MGVSLFEWNCFFVLLVLNSKKIEKVRIRFIAETSFIFLFLTIRVYCSDEPPSPVHSSLFDLLMMLGSSFYISIVETALLFPYLPYFFFFSLLLFVCAFQKLPEYFYSVLLFSTGKIAFSPKSQ